MGVTTASTKTYICDRCSREPTPSEPMTDAALPEGWMWGRPRWDCYCPECCPAARRFWKAKDAWFDARVDINVAAQAEAREKMKVWDAAHPEPTLEALPASPKE